MLGLNMTKYVTFLLKLHGMVNSLNFSHFLLVYERLSPPLPPLPRPQ